MYKMFGAQNKTSVASKAAIKLNLLLTCKRQHRSKVNNRLPRPSHFS